MGIILPTTHHHLDKYPKCATQLAFLLKTLQWLPMAFKIKSKTFNMFETASQLPQPHFSPNSNFIYNKLLMIFLTPCLDLSVWFYFCVFVCTFGPFKPCSLAPPCAASLSGSLPGFVTPPPTQVQFSHDTLAAA